MDLVSPPKNVRQVKNRPMGEMRKSIALSREKLGVFAFGLVLVDSLMTYFLKTFGYAFPVNALLPVILSAIVIRSGINSLLPRFTVIFSLCLFFLSFSVGIIFLEEFSFIRFLPLSSTMCAFLIGNYTFRYCKSEERLARLLAGIGFIYAVVCTIALLRLWPTLFPTVDAISYQDGVMKIRPEVTTDQNFQVFYLLPGIIPLVLPLKKLRTVLIILGAILSMFILARLKTRSGFLVLCGTIFLCLAVPMRIPALGRTKSFLLPVFALVTIVPAVPLILVQGEGLIERFTGSYATLYGRVESLSYMIVNLFNPVFWIPHGNAAFVEATGNVPHSNPTAFFLEGGAIGLLCWFALFVVPLVAISRRFFNGDLNPLAAMAMIGGVASLMAQMSLNVPLFEQIWLWAGAVTGALQKSKVFG